MPDYDENEINPGVRRLVRLLNDNSFITSDSGDGLTNKPTMGDEALDYPHVMIPVEPRDLVSEARRLKALLSEYGVIVPPTGMDETEPNICASFDPGDDSAIITLTNVSDLNLRQ